MRNLQNLKHTSLDFPTSNSAPLTATTWDGSSLILAFGPTQDNPAITLSRLQSSSWHPDQAIPIASWDAPSPNPDLPYDRILSLHTLPDSGSIVLIVEGGDIILVREDPQPSEDQISIVGSVDVGILAASWSPDEELLVIATKSGTLLFMTREFEGTATVTLSPSDLNVSAHVDVGWGKKETQFQGRGAKALRDPTVPERVDEGRLSAGDDGRTEISWRGDGQFVSVNSVLEDKRRVIRVYSREGVLESVSEPVDGLEAALSWKPSGQILAAVRRGAEKVEVVFFEKNGLRHGEFDLRLSKEEMEGKIDLCWNTDSSVLAVAMKDRVQLWTMGNYHYYLKQEILIDNTAGTLVNSVWHSEKPLQLACFSGSHLRILDYTFDVARGSVAPPYDHGVVAVIDGKNLKITPLRTANVPPPMAFDEVELKANAVDVAVNHQGTKIAVLHTDHISLLTCNCGSKPAQRAKFSADLPLTLQGKSTVRHIIFDHQEDIIVSSSTTNQENSILLRLSGDESSPIDIDDQISLLFGSANSDRRLYQTVKGAIHDIGGGPALGKLPTACVAVEYWENEDSHILFGLTASGTLYIQTPSQLLKIPSCTSFLVTATHLIYTTSSHLLKFIHLQAGELSIPPDEPETDERCRNVERGAKLVTVMPSAYSLVLQMPRGNLETIYPRALVLAGIRKELGAREYKKAFRICRTQRVDMNILHDYAPEHFLRDVELFVKQVGKGEWIDLVLSSLSEEDVSKTLYRDTIKLSEEAPLTNGIEATTNSAGTTSKVNRICDAFLKVLQGETHLQSIITAHVCKTPPDLSAGLSLISSLRKASKQSQLEQAVEHICFLADVNQLYDTALGLYDLDVALLVAQQSQKDPREYLPYLQKLKDMSPLRQKYSIDNDLKRYPSALTHLHAIGEFEEYTAYVVKHSLYTQAISAHRYDTPKLTTLMRLFAVYNSSRNRYKESGIAYEFIGDFPSATEAYRSAGMWQECLATALLVSPAMPAEQVEEIAIALAEGLEEAKDFTAAATIYLEHLADLEGAVRLLCRAYAFASAVRLIALHKRPSLLTSQLDPGLIEASASMTEMLAEMKSQLSAQIPRLRELRIKKLKDPMAFLDSGVDGGADIPDNISLAPSALSTSGGTFMTRYTDASMGTLATNATRKTSKNRRREERKRARGKKGTVYEEEYLVSSVERLIERWNSTAEDGGRLVEGLMRRKMRERAVAVEAAMAEVREACEGCLEEVFEGGNSGVSQVNGEAPRIVGGEGVLIEAMQASQTRKVKPVVKGFERLGLFG